MLEAMGAYSGEKVPEIEMIDIDDLIPNDKNFYRTENETEIEKQNEFLIADIEERGVIQPLLVRKAEKDDKYIIISGHRRHLVCKRLAAEGNKKARLIPCIIDEQGEVDEELTLISANATRRKDTWEEIEEMKRVEIAIIKKKEKGEKIGGRMQSLIAERMGISKSTVGRLQQIEKNLEPEIKESLKNGDIAKSPAVELSKMSAADQKAIYEKTGGKITQTDIDEYEKEKMILQQSEKSMMDEMEQNPCYAEGNYVEENMEVEEEQEKKSKPQTIKKEASIEEKISAAKYAMKVLEKAICKSASLRDIEEQEGNQDKARQQIVNIEYLGGVMKNVQADLFAMTGSDIFKEDAD